MGFIFRLDTKKTAHRRKKERMKRARSSGQLAKKKNELREFIKRCAVVTDEGRGLDDGKDHSKDPFEIVVGEALESKKESLDSLEEDLDENYQIAVVGPTADRTALLMVVPIVQEYRLMSLPVVFERYRLSDYDSEEERKSKKAKKGDGGSKGSSSPKWGYTAFVELPRECGVRQAAIDEVLLQAQKNEAERDEMATHAAKK